MTVNEEDKVTKVFGKDFNSEGGALTLRPSDVSDDTDVVNGHHSKYHDESDWTISGEVCEDYFVWVNEFEATHPKHGYVKGDFEETVTASSEEAFEHFWEHHEPEEWDYQDI